MKYENRIKIDGDFSIAKQWLGFAKNKANFLYDLSSKHGVNYQKTYTPTGDVTVKVSIIQKIPYIYIKADGGYYLSGIIKLNQRELYDHDKNPETDDIYGIKYLFPSPKMTKNGNYKKEWITTYKIHSEYNPKIGFFQLEGFGTNKSYYSIVNPDDYYVRHKNFTLKSGNFTGLLQKYIQLTLGTQKDIKLESNYLKSHGLARKDKDSELWLIQICSPYNEIIEKSDFVNIDDFYTLNNNGGIYATKFFHKNGIIETVEFPEITDENIDSGLIIKLLDSEQLESFYKNRNALFFECGWSFDYIDGNNAVNVSPKFYVQSDLSRTSIFSTKTFKITINFDNFGKPESANINEIYSHIHESDIYKPTYSVKLKIPNNSNDYLNIFIKDNEKITFYSFYEEGNDEITNVSCQHKIVDENIAKSLVSRYVTNNIIDDWSWNHYVSGCYFPYTVFEIDNGKDIFTEICYDNSYFTKIKHFLFNSETGFSDFSSETRLKINNDSLCFIPYNDRTSVVFYNNINPVGTYITTDLVSAKTQNDLDLDFLSGLGIFNDYIFIEKFNLNDITPVSAVVKYYDDNDIDQMHPLYKTVTENINNRIVSFEANKTSVYKKNKFDIFKNNTNLFLNNFTLTNLREIVRDNPFDYAGLNCSISYDIFSSKYITLLYSFYNQKKILGYYRTHDNNLLYNGPVPIPENPDFPYERYPLIENYVNFLTKTKKDSNNYTNINVISNLSNKDKLHYNLNDIYFDYTFSVYHQYQVVNNRFFGYVINFTFDLKYYIYQMFSISFIGKPFE